MPSTRPIYSSPFRDVHDVASLVRAVRAEFGLVYSAIGQVEGGGISSGGGAESDPVFAEWLRDDYNPGSTLTNADRINWNNAHQWSGALFNHDGDGSHWWWYRPDRTVDTSGSVYTTVARAEQLTGMTAEQLRLQRIPAYGFGIAGETGVRTNFDLDQTTTHNLSSDAHIISGWQWTEVILTHLFGDLTESIYTNFVHIREGTGVGNEAMAVLDHIRALEAAPPGEGGGGGGEVTLAQFNTLQSDVNRIDGTVGTNSTAITRLRADVGDWDLTNDVSLTTILGAWTRSETIKDRDDVLGELETFRDRIQNAFAAGTYSNNMTLDARLGVLERGEGTDHRGVGTRADGDSIPTNKTLWAWADDAYDIADRLAPVVDNALGDAYASNLDTLPVRVGRLEDGNIGTDSSNLGQTLWHWMRRVLENIRNSDGAFVNVATLRGEFNEHQMAAQEVIDEVGTHFEAPHPLAGVELWSAVDTNRTGIETINDDVLGTKSTTDFMPVPNDANADKIWGILSSHKADIRLVKNTADNVNLRVFGRLASPGMPAVEGLSTQYNDLNNLVRNTVLNANLPSTLDTALLARVNALTTRVGDAEGHHEEDGVVYVIKKMLGIPDSLPDSFTAATTEDWWTSYDGRNFAWLSEFNDFGAYVRGYLWGQDFQVVNELLFDANDEPLLNDDGTQQSRRFGLEQVINSILLSTRTGALDLYDPDDPTVIFPDNIKSNPDLDAKDREIETTIDLLESELIGTADDLDVFGEVRTLTAILRLLNDSINTNRDAITDRAAEFKNFRNRVGIPSEGSAVQLAAWLGLAPTDLTLWGVVQELQQREEELVERLSFGNDFDFDQDQDAWIGHEVPRWIGVFPVYRGDPSDPSTAVNIDLPKVVSGDSANVIYSVNPEIATRLHHNPYTNTLSGFLEEGYDFISRALIITATDTVTGQQTRCWGRINGGGTVDGQKALAQLIFPTYYTTADLTQTNFEAGAPWSDPVPQRLTPGEGAGQEITERNFDLHRPSRSWNANCERHFSFVATTSPPDSEVTATGTLLRGWWTPRLYVVVPRGGTILTPQPAAEWDANGRTFNSNNPVVRVLIERNLGPAAASWKAEYELISIRLFVVNFASDTAHHTQITLNSGVGRQSPPFPFGSAEFANAAGAVSFFGEIDLFTRVDAQADLDPSYDGVTMPVIEDARKGIPITPVLLPKPNSGNPPFRYEMTDELPAGLTLDGRRISGTPTVAVPTATVYRFLVRDSGDNVEGGASQSEPGTVTITIEDNTTPDFQRTQNAITYTATVPSARIILPEADGGEGDLTYTLVAADGGIRPPGINWDAVSRTLSGTAAVEAAPRQFIYTATDADGDSASLRFNIEVLAAPVAQSGRVFSLTKADPITVREPIFLSTEGRDVRFEVDDSLTVAGGSASGLEAFWYPLAADVDRFAQMRNYGYYAENDANNPDRAAAQAAADSGDLTTTFWDVLKEIRLVVYYGPEQNRVEYPFRALQELSQELIYDTEQREQTFTYQDYVTVVEEVEDTEQITTTTTRIDEGQAARRAALEAAKASAETELDAKLIELYGPDKVSGGGDGGAEEDEAAAEAAYDAAVIAAANALTDRDNKRDLRDAKRDEISDLEDELADLEQDYQDAVDAAPVSEVGNAQERLELENAVVTARVARELQRPVWDAAQDAVDAKRRTIEVLIGRNGGTSKRYFELESLAVANRVVYEDFAATLPPLHTAASTSGPLFRRYEREIDNHPWLLRVGVAQDPISRLLPGGQGFDVVYNIGELLDGTADIRLGSSDRSEILQFRNGARSLALRQATEGASLAIALPLVDETVSLVVSTSNAAARGLANAHLNAALSQHRQALARMSSLAQRDAISGVFSRTEFQNTAKQVLSTNRRLDTALTNRNQVLARTVTRARAASSVASAASAIIALVIEEVQRFVSTLTNVVYNSRRRVAERAMQAAFDKYLDARIEVAVASEAATKYLRSAVLPAERNAQNQYDRLEREIDELNEEKDNLDDLIDTRDEERNRFRLLTQALNDAQAALAAWTPTYTTTPGSTGAQLQALQDLITAKEAEIETAEGELDDLQDDYDEAIVTFRTLRDDRDSKREDRDAARELTAELRSELRELGGTVQQNANELDRLGTDDTFTDTDTETVTRVRTQTVRTLVDVTKTYFEDVQVIAGVESSVEAYVWFGEALVNDALLSFVFRIRYDRLNSYDSEGDAIPDITLAYRVHNHIFLKTETQEIPDPADPTQTIILPETDEVPRIDLEIEWSPPGEYELDEDGDIVMEGGVAKPLTVVDTVFTRDFVDPKWQSVGVPQLVSAFGREITDREVYEGGTFVDTEEILRTLRILNDRQFRQGDSFFVNQFGQQQFRIYQEPSALLLLRTTDVGGVFSSTAFVPADRKNLTGWQHALEGPEIDDAHLAVDLKFARDRLVLNTNFVGGGTNLEDYRELAWYLSSAPHHEDPGPGSDTAFNWTELTVANVGPGSAYRRERGFEDAMGNPINPYV